jgi:hypothetical protein
VLAAASVVGGDVLDVCHQAAAVVAQPSRALESGHQQPSRTPRPLAGSEAALGEQADEVRACGWWVVDFDPAEHLAFGYA